MISRSQLSLEPNIDPTHGARRIFTSLRKSQPKEWRRGIQEVVASRRGAMASGVAAASGGAVVVLEQADK